MPLGFLATLERFRDEPSQIWVNTSRVIINRGRLKGVLWQRELQDYPGAVLPRQQTLSSQVHFPRWGRGQLLDWRPSSGQSAPEFPSFRKEPDRTSWHYRCWQNEQYVVGFFRILIMFSFLSFQFQSLPIFFPHSIFVWPLSSFSFSLFFSQLLTKSLQSSEITEGRGRRKSKCGICNSL